MDIVKQFQELTNSDENTAKFFIESANGDLDTAVNNFFQNPEQPRQQQQQAPQQPQTSTTRKSEPPKKGGMFTFNDLGSGSADNKDDKANKYYAGGSTNSGNLILGRDDDQEKNNADDLTAQIFKKAQDRLAGGEPMQAEENRFSGRGNRLGSQPSDPMDARSGNASDQQGVVDEKQVTITFYQDGFTIDDGELRRFDDEKNRQFLEAINNGYVPREVAGMAKEVLVSLVDKKSEKYAAQKKSFEAFKGEGRSLGAARSVPSSSTPVSTQPVTPPSYSVDPNRPSTTLQIRLHDGTRLNATFNLDDTVQTLIQFVQASRPNVGAFQLQTSFPRKVLTDPSQTIEQAGLKGAVLLQTLI